MVVYIHNLKTIYQYQENIEPDNTNCPSFFLHIFCRIILKPKIKLNQLIALQWDKCVFSIVSWNTKVFMLATKGSVIICSSRLGLYLENDAYKGITLDM